MKLRINEVDAPIWKRLLAYIIDAIIVNLIVILPFQKSINKLTEGILTTHILGLYAYINSNQEVMRRTLPGLALLFFIIAVLTIAYWAILEYKTRQSIGKMLMGIEVKSEEKMLTLKQTIIRNISKISGILLLIDSLGILGNRQRYLDRLAKTRVVEKRFTI